MENSLQVAKILDISDFFSLLKRILSHLQITWCDRTLQLTLFV
jgi:hypothetical protein